MIQAELLIKKYEEYALIFDSELPILEKHFLEAEMSRDYDNEYAIYIRFFNKATGQKQKGDIESRKKFYSREHYFSNEDRFQTLQNVLKIDYFMTKGKYVVTPINMLDAKNISKYASYEPTGNKSNNRTSEEDSTIPEGFTNLDF